MKFTVFAALAAIALPAVALPLAAHAQAGDIEIVDPYARSANPKSGAAFMVIRNTGSRDCTLTGVASEAAEITELHTHMDQGGGVMKMMKLEGGLPIPAGAEHALMRGGDHVMMMGLKKPLENGQQVIVTLDLGECGVHAVEMPVDNDRKPEAAGGMGMTHGAGHAAPAPAAN